MTGSPKDLHDGAAGFTGSTSDAARLSAALAGRYRIERELGAGGMATVYLAADLRHDRKVAIKVLKPELAAVLGADRFLVEIKTTAALQHPHILPLFDSGSADGFLFYVMPYVEGETIREKLNRETQFGVDEAVRIAREVADALDYAHRHGVIHRDVKPENVLLHDGRAIVMDFGIALALSVAGGGRMTETGLSLGTPHYMSPEQATAEKDLTPRSDIYSLASVLYEMLSGQPPHVGGSAQQVIMKIITEPAAAVATHRKSVPPNVAAAVAKALEKLPADRFDTAKAFSDALVDPSFTADVTVVAPDGARGRAAVSRIAFIATAAVAIVALAGLLWSLRRTHTTPEEPVVRVLVDLPPGDRMYPAAGGSTVAIAPQGDRVVFVAQGPSGAHMMIRRTSEFTARDLTSAVVSQPVFSPDGRWVAFVDGNRLAKVSVDGGSSVSLGESPLIRGLVWTERDTILIGSDLGLFMVSSKGGTLRRHPAVDSTKPALYPALLSDGKTVAYTTGGISSARQIVITSLATRKSTALEIAAATVLGMREGHLLYVTASGELDGVPLDLDKQRTTGDAIHLETGIRLSAAGQALVSLSANGSLWFVTGQSLGHLVHVSPTHPETPLFDELRAFKNPRFSPDGQRVAVEVSGAVKNAIWVYDRVNHTFSPLTSEQTASFPEWSPDGKRVLFRAGSASELGIFWQPIDGSSRAELLYKPEDVFNEALLSPDGKWLIYRTAPGVHNRDIYAVALGGDKKAKLLVGGPAQESHPRVSPNGKWIAYQSNESQRYEVYVRPFPNVDAGARVQVSTQGGAEPLWSRSGTTLFYRSLTGGVESATVVAGTTFEVKERRTVLPPADYLTDISHASYDLWPDGNGFLMVKPTGGETRPTLAYNWGRELRDKLSAGKRN
ncbi:MAG TPA: protein kinase [Gemmatimonadaceae bacterium]|nr:protein kinase [Gemmatimonadaceae bacterium]